MAEKEASAKEKENGDGGREHDRFQAAHVDAVLMPIQDKHVCEIMQCFH